MTPRDQGRDLEELKRAVVSVSYTPGRRDFAALVELLGGDEDVAEQVDRALARSGRYAAQFLLDHYAPTRAPARARVVRALGRIAGNESEPELSARIRDWLKERLVDEDAKARRNAIGALGKIAREHDDEIERSLIEAWSREAEVHQKRSIAEALGKAGDARSLELLSSVETEDPELRRIVDAAVLRLRGRTTRVGQGTAAAGIDLDGSARGFELVMRCRHGLEEIVRDEAPREWGVHVVGRGVLRGRFGGKLRELFQVRTALSFGFALPSREGEFERAIVDAVTSKEALAIFGAFSTGGVRYRIEWAGAGKKRAAVFRVAEAIDKASLDDARGAPANRLVNDPSQRNWDVVVFDVGGRPEVELRPRAVDPRFEFRTRDVPAASHPTLAAALARLGGVRSDDVVWDPFVGSGTELVERARLGPYRALLGTDQDEEALASARSNLDAAGLRDARLTHADSLAADPAGVTLILSNPPMGRRVHRHEDLTTFFDRFIDLAARVLVAGGRLVWISPLGPRTAARATRAGFKVHLRRSVDMGGFEAEIQVMERSR